MKNHTAESIPYALTIAGFDPCGGAGVLADVKTLDTLGVHSLAVLTSRTVQVEDHFHSVAWCSLEETLHTLCVLLQRYAVGAVKIGLAPNFATVARYVQQVRAYTEVPVVIDPIAAPTAAEHPEHFLQHDAHHIEQVLMPGVILTPNVPEYALYLESLGAPDALCKRTGVTIILKGGHRPGQQLCNELYLPNGERHTFVTPRAAGDKHGTGCIFSAALCAYQAQGLSLMQALPRVQAYLHAYVASSTTGLGLHSVAWRRAEGL